MLTSNSDIKSIDELILEKETLCAELEAGNPFFNNQEFVFSQPIDDIEQEESCQVTSEEIHSEAIDKILRENLRVSLRRANKNPQNPALANEAALEYLKRGKIQKAIDGFEKALLIDKTFFPAIANLARCYSIKGDFDRALEIYEDLEQMSKDDVRFLSNIALIHFSKKDFNVSQQYLKRALSLDKENHSLLNNLGLVNLAKNNVSNAISLIRRAVRIKNDDYTAYNNLGVCYLALNNYRKALHFFKIAYKLNKNARDVIKNITNTYHRIGDHNRVVDLLDEYVRIHPEDIELRSLLGWSYFNLEEYKKCIKQLQQSLNHTKEEEINKIASLYNNMAVVYDKIGYTKKALDLYSKSLEKNPNANVIVLNNVIAFSFKHSSLKNTKKIIDSSLEIHPGNHVLLGYLGRFYEERHEYEEAKDIYYRIHKSDKTNLMPYLRLSSIDLDVFENTSDALAILEEGLPLFHESVAFINNYAYCQLLIGDIPKAKKYLEKIKNVEDVYLSATRGLLSIKEGDILEGRKLYNRAAFLAMDDKNLKARVNQKKFLELGKYYYNIGEKKEALRLLEKGLKFKSKEKYFENQIIALMNNINNLE